ncbi:MAG: GIY-YIG nuclease family protein, partial [Patescibacteria group bacterium]
MIQYYIYAIKSYKDGRLYVGISRNPESRLIEHNSGMTKSTKPFRPWKIVFKRFIGDRKSARIEEK